MYSQLVDTLQMEWEVRFFKRKSDNMQIQLGVTSFTKTCTLRAMQSVHCTTYTTTQKKEQGQPP